MASIRGIKLTGIQSHMGLEGYTLFAKVNMDGKVVGFVRDDAYGGPMDIEIPADIQKELQKRYREYIRDAKKVDQMKLFGMTKEEYVRLRDAGTLPLQEDADLEYLFSELADLAQTEKKFKNAVKKGYKAYVTVQFHHLAGPTPVDYAYMTNGTVPVFADIFSEAERKHPAVTVTQYKSLDDFNL